VAALGCSLAIHEDSTATDEDPVLTPRAFVTTSSSQGCDGPAVYKALLSFTDGNLCI
jgi:predicted amidohydrolase YtcJ